MPSLLFLLQQTRHSDTYIKTVYDNITGVNIRRNIIEHTFGYNSCVAVQVFRSTCSPLTVSAHTHLIGLHAYKFSTNQSDAYTFSTGQSQIYKNSTGQSQACRFSTVGFCWWPVIVPSPTDTACTQATRRVWAGNPAFKTSKTKQEKKSLSRLT